MMHQIVTHRLRGAVPLLENLLDLALFVAGQTPPEQCLAKLTWQNLALALEQALRMTRHRLGDE